MSELKGFKELSARLKRMDSKLAQKVVRRGSARMAQTIAKEMKKNAPRKTGNLKKSITYSNKRNRQGGFSAKVGAFRTGRADGFYAKFIEFGAKKHTIKPKNRKAISFNGAVVKSVNHPGTRARPFIQRSFEQSQKRAVDEAGRIMFKLIADLK